MRHSRMAKDVIMGEIPVGPATSALQKLPARRSLPEGIPSPRGRHALLMRGKSHPTTFWYGSRRLRSNAFCCAAILAKAVTCSSVRRRSFGSLIHSRMIFRRVSCSFISMALLLSHKELYCSLARGLRVPTFACCVAEATLLRSLVPSVCIGRCSRARLLRCPAMVSETPRNLTRDSAAARNGPRHFS